MWLIVETSFPPGIFGNALFEIYRPWKVLFLIILAALLNVDMKENYE